MKPIFTHDCDDCEFLGTSQAKDMYICPETGTKVVRYGNDGPEYVSSTNYFTFSELLAMA